MFLFDVFDVAPHQEEEYAQEMTEAASQPSSQQTVTYDSTTQLVILTDEASLAAGEEIWTKQCVVCHLAAGQGLVGPNLCDTFAIHGCDYEDVVKIIRVGAPEKGMISWTAQLSDEQILQISSYTMTLLGTDPPNPKAPQGDPCK